MRIAMIGSGYVGLVSGACFADLGHEVTCIDRDEAKVDALRNGQIPIFEPGLQELVARNIDKKRLSFTSDLAGAVKDIDAVFVCVGTPSQESGSADLGAVNDVVCAVAKAVSGFTTVVMKSTVPVGTGDKLAALIKEVRPDADIAFVSNPEFLREGVAIQDFKNPDRIVIGMEDERARAIMAGIYKPLSADHLIMYTGRRTAEVIKYAANAFLATKLTFINEIADLCEQAGASITEVARGIGLDARIGTKYLQAGPGYGGSCLPKDTRALLTIAKEHGVTLRLVADVVALNEERKRAMARKVITTMGGSAKGKTVALLGLAFKADTDDMRESPAIGIIEALQQAGARIRAYDPEAMQQAAKVLSDVEYVDDAYRCATGADAVVLVTEWEEFRALDLSRLHGLLKAKIFVDLRNLYDPAAMRALGFTYESIGRPKD